MLSDETVLLVGALILCVLLLAAVAARREFRKLLASVSVDQLRRGYIAVAGMISSTQENVDLVGRKVDSFSSCLFRQDDRCRHDARDLDSLADIRTMLLTMMESYYFLRHTGNGQLFRFTKVLAKRHDMQLIPAIEAIRIIDGSTNVSVVQVSRAPEPPAEVVEEDELDRYAPEFMTKEKSRHDVKNMHIGLTEQVWEGDS